MDLYAAIPQKIEIKPLERLLVPTGIAIALPTGFEAQIRARSGLAFSRGLGLANSVGTIDADYRGEIKVLMINFSNATSVIEPRERIAQMVIAPVMHVTWHEVEALPVTVRGPGGFGHTGSH